MKKHPRLPVYCSGCRGRRSFYIMYLLYHSTVIPQRRLYAQYIQANGLDTTLHYLNSIYEGITSRDSERAKREMLAMLNIALEGPTAVV